MNEGFSIRNDYEKGVNVSSRVGEIVEVKREPRIKYPAGGSSRYADVEIIYSSGARLLLNHSYYTSGRKSKSGKIFLTTPKSYVIISATLQIPRKGGKGFFEKWWTGSKEFKSKSNKTRNATKRMEKHLKKTLNLVVSYGDWHTPKILRK